MQELDMTEYGIDENTIESNGSLSTLFNRCTPITPNTQGLFFSLKLQNFCLITAKTEQERQFVSFISSSIQSKTLPEFLKANPGYFTFLTDLIQKNMKKYTNQSKFSEIFSAGMSFGFTTVVFYNNPRGELAVVAKFLSESVVKFFYYMSTGKYFLLFPINEAEMVSKTKTRELFEQIVNRPSPDIFAHCGHILYPQRTNNGYKCMHCHTQLYTAELLNLETKEKYENPSETMQYSLKRCSKHRDSWGLLILSCHCKQCNSDIVSYEKCNSGHRLSPTSRLDLLIFSQIQFNKGQQLIQCRKCQMTEYPFFLYAQQKHECFSILCALCGLQAAKTRKSCPLCGAGINYP